MKKFAFIACIVGLAAVGALAVTTPKNVTGSNLSDVIAEVVHGTSAAGKAVILDTNLRINDLDVTALEIGNVDVTATGTEINNSCDVSGQLQAIVAAGAVTVDGSKRRATLSGGAYAITLAVPGAAAIGAVLVIEYAGGDTDAVTLALTNVIGESGGTTATFNADGEGLVLIGTTLGWVVLAEFGGVTLA